MNKVLAVTSAKKPKTVDRDTNMKWWITKSSSNPHHTACKLVSLSINANFVDSETRRARCSLAFIHRLPLLGKCRQALETVLSRDHLFTHFQ